MIGGLVLAVGCWRLVLCVCVVCVVFGFSVCLGFVCFRFVFGGAVGGREGGSRVRGHCGYVSEGDSLWHWSDGVGIGKFLGGGMGYGERGK